MNKIEIKQPLDNTKIIKVFKEKTKVQEFNLQKH